MYQKKLKLSLLDYSPVDEGLMPHDALSATVRLAQSAEKNGFHRYWVSEHHGMPAISGNSPEILMARIASATQKIRLGSGAVLLPNYSSLKIAENYQLLESLFPNRIDLGFGRAPGADSRTGSALNDEKGRTIPYPQKVSDLIGFITGKHSENSHYAGMKAYPETNTKPQPFVLGASGSTAQFAAKMGLGFTFAHFINPGFTGPHAADEYRDAFQKSDFSEKPTVIVCVFVVIGNTEQEAKEFADAFHLWLSYAESAHPFSRIPSLESSRKHSWSYSELAVREQNKHRLISGTASAVAEKLRNLADSYDTDEVMINLMMPGEASRINALEILSAQPGMSVGD
ncbi:LLM class flavin-dependent oxidoreductase [Tatumella citrea]|uniref:Luciferase n=1 Tax=Tatumella citrea TaxID=53336 RepID=A0A1Y0LCF7_TATCI|nr:LLM class flavin-dependent oxidoreductase [Tatumella citrea]ARU95350.1 luciferase [Tatumella citrea]ARU99391.1 luciferase [Tatumella citrea]